MSGGEQELPELSRANGWPSMLATLNGLLRENADRGCTRYGILSVEERVALKVVCCFLELAEDLEAAGS